MKLCSYICRYIFSVDGVDVWTLLYVFVQDWGDMEVVAEVSGWLLPFWRVAESVREDSSSAQLLWSAVHHR